MENNIIEIGASVIIINGGNPLEGCPKDWDKAREIEEQLNQGKEGDDIKWKFDCGFKLDFDGSLIRISSRFYPPKTHYGTTWDGTVSIFMMDREVAEKKFDCNSLSELKSQVESYVNSIIKRIESIF